MSWNDWEAAWKRQPPPIGATADFSEIKRSFEGQRRKAACTFLMRNLCEGGTGIVVTAILARLTWRHGLAGWPIGVSAAVFFAITCVFIVDLIKSGRNRLGPAAPLLAVTEREALELRHQYRLLRTWWAWYLVPSAIGLAFGFVGLGRLNPDNAPPHLLKELFTTPITLAWIVILVAVIAFAARIVWRANCQALRNIRLRLEEVETLRRHIMLDEHTDV